MKKKLRKLNKVMITQFLHIHIEILLFCGAVVDRNIVFLEAKKTWFLTFPPCQESIPPILNNTLFPLI